MDFTVDEFRQWLRLNRNHFLYDGGGYTREEVTELALLSGFELKIIYQELSHFQDALRGSNFDNKAKMHINHETITIEMLSGKHDLNEQWEALGKKLNQGRDFDDDQ